MASTSNDPPGTTPHVKDTEVSSHIENPKQDEVVDDLAYLDEVSHEQHVKTFRKVDWHLMPMLMCLYLIANLDRYVTGKGSLHLDVYTNADMSILILGRTSEMPRSKDSRLISA